MTRARLFPAMPAADCVNFYSDSHPSRPPDVFPKSNRTVPDANSRALPSMEDATRRPSSIRRFQKAEPDQSPRWPHPSVQYAASELQSQMGKISISSDKNHYLGTHLHGKLDRIDGHQHVNVCFVVLTVS